MSTLTTAVAALTTTVPANRPGMLSMRSTAPATRTRLAHHSPRSSPSRRRTTAASGAKAPMHSGGSSPSRETVAGLKPATGASGPIWPKATRVFRLISTKPTTSSAPAPAAGGALR
ncbi:hypothetical protein GCM10020254_84730 [Streptomyces goshikiensis]